jgi:hypothetical protein
LLPVDEFSELVADIAKLEAFQPTTTDRKGATHFLDSPGGWQ